MNEETSYLLAVNGGSSSLKFGIYQARTHWLELSGHIAPFGPGEARFVITSAEKETLLDRKLSCPDTATATRELISWLQSQSGRYPLSAIGHRIVQGGLHHREPGIITDEVIASLQGLVELAPDHLPSEIAIVHAFRQAFPEALPVACFDTAFHRDMPAYAQHYPIPRPLWEEGLIRYGFHGLSYESILQELKRLTFAGKKDRIIIAHLGNGASMAAIHKGKCVETTMGLTPAGGLIMGTRPGDLDPGLLLYLLRQKKMTPEQLDILVNRDCGLKALSGGSSDMQDLLAREASDPKAAEAIAQFCYQAKKFIGSLVAVLGGLDTLVFTGGIGENAPLIRSRIATGLTFLGIRLDETANERQQEIISYPDAAVRVCVIRTNEEGMIAAHAGRLLESHLSTRGST